MDSLKDYVKVTPSIPKKLCKKLVKELDNNDWLEHKFIHYYGEINYNIQKAPCETLPDNIKLENSQELMNSLHGVIENYIKNLNTPYFNSWNGYTYTKFNRYKVGTSMEKHVDHIHNLFDGTTKGIPTLSIIGLLNDTFEGGEIEMFEDTKIKLKAGEVLIFPSIFLFPHMICPITKGNRYSFVSWVY